MDPVLETQTWEVCDYIWWQKDRSGACATSHISGRTPPAGETTLSGSLACSWTVCPLSHSSARECAWPLALSACDYTRRESSLQRRAPREPDLMPPSLLMYETTVVLSVATKIIWPQQCCSNFLSANRTTF